MSDSRRPSPLETVDTHVGTIPAGKNRRIEVHRRRHAGKTYIRFRYWHKHRITGYWYPDSHFNGPRAFLLPVEVAPALGKALIAASRAKKSDRGDGIRKRKSENST